MRAVTRIKRPGWSSACRPCIIKMLTFIAVCCDLTFFFFFCSSSFVLVKVLVAFNTDPIATSEAKRLSVKHGFRPCILQGAGVTFNI